jgi:hypothetical protein
VVFATRSISSMGISGFVKAIADPSGRGIAPRARDGSSRFLRLDQIYPR